VQSRYTSDADELEVAQRARPYDPDSWHTEWMRVGEKNEKVADGYAAQGFKVSAAEHYRRAQDFYGNAAWPLPDTDRRMLPSYQKIRDMSEKAGRMVRPPFERITVGFDGKQLEGYFRKPGGARARHVRAVIALQRADTHPDDAIT